MIISVTAMHRARTLVNTISGRRSKQLYASWLLTKNFLAAASCNANTVVYQSTKVAKEPFLNGTTSNYIEDMYNAWLADPSSVHKVSTHSCLLNGIKSTVFSKYFLFVTNMKIIVDFDLMLMIVKTTMSNKQLITFDSFWYNFVLHLIKYS